MFVIHQRSVSITDRGLHSPATIKHGHDPVFFPDGCHAPRPRAIQRGGGGRAARARH